jgi:dTDP-4-amino-4,6-dideoxygalactose transaminase
VATFALHRIGSFAHRPGFSRERLPVSDLLHDRALALPLWNGMTKDDPARVVGALARMLA